jgi:hypothetical protein
MKNLLKLASVFVLLNASSDMIQDLLLGRPIEMSDVVVDNMMKLVGSSRYQGQRFVKEGFTGIASQILPPFKFANALVKDIKEAGDEKGLEVTQSIPLVGKLYYWWFGKGSIRKSDKEKKEQKKAIKERNSFMKAKSKLEEERFTMKESKKKDKDNMRFSIRSNKDI